MGNPQLPPDFKEFLHFCLDRKVRFLVIGGMAVIHYGYPRLTLDLDVWVEPTPENGERIIEALKDFGFKNPEVTPEYFAKERQILRMGFQPQVIALFNTILGVTFEECYPNHMAVVIDGRPVPFIGLSDLRKNKAASGRTKDLLDLEELPEILEK